MLSYALLLLVGSSVSPTCSTSSTIVDFGNAPISTVGNASVVGDVYLMDTTSMTLTGNGKVSGQVHEQSSGMITTTGNAKVVGGTVVADLSSLESGLNTLVSDATNSTVTQTFGTINSSTTINGNGGVNVIKVSSDVSLAGNNTLTLSGNSADVFIINVYGGVSLSGNANVMLVGGVLPQNVLWNVVGTGSALTITGNGSVAGTFLAPQRSVQVSGNGELTGSIYAGGTGNSIALTGNGFVWRTSAFCGNGWNPVNIFF